jgi:hypothetical protein
MGEEWLKPYDLSNSRMRAIAQVSVTWEVGWAAFARYLGKLPLLVPREENRAGLGSRFEKTGICVPG